MSQSKILRRSRRDRLFAGVIGGLADYLDVSPFGLRIAYVLVSLFSAGFPGLLIYVVLALVLPVED